MELRDYLMPDEYIVSVTEGHYEISSEKYNRIAITNKRILIYNEKPKLGILRGGRGDIKSIRSWHLNTIDHVEINLKERVPLAMVFKHQPAVWIRLKNRESILIWISKWDALNNFNKLQSAFESAAKKIEEMKFLERYKYYF